MSAVTFPRRVFGLSVCAAALVLATWRAEAHAQLRHADPPVGASLGVAPAQVSLIFSEGVEPAFSSVTVTDAAGARVDRDDLRRDLAQITHLLLGLKSLSPGSYRVDWKVTSIDTHKTQGSYSFVVLAPSNGTPRTP